MHKLRVGLIGTGVISDIYLKTSQKFDILDFVACGSLDVEESRGKAEKYDIPRVCSPDEIIDDPDIDCVLNLTIPAAHAEISLAALEAGKHVYAEKPFATSIEDGKKILALAKSKGLLRKSIHRSWGSAKCNSVWNAISIRCTSRNRWRPAQRTSRCTMNRAITPGINTKPLRRESLWRLKCCHQTSLVSNKKK